MAILVEKYKAILQNKLGVSLDILHGNSQPGKDVFSHGISATEHVNNHTWASIKYFCVEIFFTLSALHIPDIHAGQLLVPHNFKCSYFQTSQTNQCCVANVHFCPDGASNAHFISFCLQLHSLQKMQKVKILVEMWQMVRILQGLIQHANTKGVECLVTIK